MTLDRVRPKLLCGSEGLGPSDNGPSVSLLRFWQWSGSSLLDNTARGVLAEFLVAHVLGIDGTPRREWEPYDLRTRIDGRPVKIEVKSSARVQAWKQKTFSPIRFNIAKARRWDPEEGRFRAQTARRCADVYVFCTLESREIHEHCQALDTDQWRFYVVHTCALDEKFGEQETATLGSLEERLGQHFNECCYSTLAQTIHDVARRTARLVQA